MFTYVGNVYTQVRILWVEDDEMPAARTRARGKSPSDPDSLLKPRWITTLSTTQEARHKALSLLRSERRWFSGSAAWCSVNTREALRHRNREQAIAFDTQRS